MSTPSFFRSLTAVAMAAGLMAASSAATAAASAQVQLYPALTDSFAFFGVNISASGAATYLNNTFSSAASNVLPGDTKLTWDPTAALTFTITGNGAITFDGLVYDSATSSVLGDVHFVNGNVSQNFSDKVLFSVGTLTPAFSTLSSGGSASAEFKLGGGLSEVASSLGITVPIPAVNVGKLTITTTAVPEPSTWALGLSGLMGVAVAAVRRRRQG